MSQLNTNNFFRWYSGNVTDEQSINLPRLGVQDAKIYLPVLVSGEGVGFFINSDIPFYDGDQLADLQLRLSDGTVVGTVMQSVVLTSGYRLYADFTLPAVSPGQYQFEIYNTSTLTVKCTSNYFQISDAIEALNTCTVKWRNSRDAYDYNWSSILTDFYCRLRLHLSLTSYGAEGTIDQTKAVSTGLRRNNNYDLDFSVKLTTYYFDDGANMACIPLFVASDIYVNGKKYINKTLYVPNIRVISKVNLGEIELYDQPFSTINKYGQLPQKVQITGQYVIMNNTSVVFTIHKYSAGGTAIGTVPVPVNGVVAIQASDLQYNSYLNITAAANGNYTAATAYSVNSSFVRSKNAITTTAASNQVTQNQIYQNDYFVCLY